MIRYCDGLVYSSWRGPAVKLSLSMMNCVDSQLTSWILSLSIYYQCCLDDVDIVSMRASVVPMMGHSLRLWPTIGMLPSRESICDCCLRRGDSDVSHGWQDPAGGQQARLQWLLAPSNIITLARTNVAPPALQSAALSGHSLHYH